MKRFILIVVAALLGVLVVVSVSGCTSNPRVDYANTQDAYNATVQTLVTNRDEFSETTWKDDILPLINAGDTALDQYDALTAAGLDNAGPRGTLRQVLLGLAEFLDELE